MHCKRNTWFIINRAVLNSARDGKHSVAGERHSDLPIVARRPTK